MNKTSFRLGELKRETAFEAAPDAAARAEVAERLGILGVKKLRFSGTLSPLRKSDWQLNARLGATVVQACVVTNEPVTTRIDEDVVRGYLADLPQITDLEESEMPEDETLDPLPEVLDIADVMEEALALALPPWPRADGVDPLEMSVTEPGTAPLTDADVKPFASLKSLKEKLSGNDEDEA